MMFFGRRRGKERRDNDGDRPPVRWRVISREPVKPCDGNDAFRPVAQESGALRRLAVRGAGVTVFSGALGQFIQIIATMALARLLTPLDFGVVAMVMTFSLLVANFGLNGFKEAVLQREEIDHYLASNLFWINIGTGLFLTAGFAASGPLVARFYNNPHVTRVAIGMSATIFMTSISVVHLALLQRAMRFSAIAANDIVARIVSLVSSLLLAYAGCGYWALVAGAVAQSFSASLGVFLLCRWAPGPPRRVPGTASMVQFALQVYGRFSFNYGARNMDNVLVGSRFNAQALGFYKKAYDLFALSGSLLVSSLTPVAVSTLSRLNRDTVQYKRRLLSLMALTAFVGMGVGASLTLVGKDAIRLLLGPQWEPSGRVFSYFGPGIGIMLLYGTHGWIHLSIGKPGRWFRWGIVEFAVTGGLFFAALPWGPEGIAIAWTASFCILTIPALWYAGRPIQLGTWPVLAAVWRYFVASLLAGCGTAAIFRNVPPFGIARGGIAAAARIAATSSLFCVLYLGAVILVFGSRAPLYQVVGLLGEMMPWTRRQETQPAKVATAIVV